MAIRKGMVNKVKAPKFFPPMPAKIKARIPKASNGQSPRLVQKS